MKPIIIDPTHVKDVVNESKPALLTISKTNLIFNYNATKLLAFKNGDKFNLQIIDNKLSIKVPVTDGFKVNINKRGYASTTCPGIMDALNKHVKISSKNVRYEIGEFKDGFWPLIPTDGQKTTVK